MRATVMFGAGDVRIENVPDARIIEATDAIVAVTRACICGSDLWPYQQMEPSDTGRVMGHEAIGVVEAVAVRSGTSSGVMSSSCRSHFPTEHASSATMACKRRACTAAFLARPK